VIIFNDFVKCSDFLQQNRIVHGGGGGG